MFCMHYIFYKGIYCVNIITILKKPRSRCPTRRLFIRMGPHRVRPIQLVLGKSPILTWQFRRKSQTRYTITYDAMTHTQTRVYAKFATWQSTYRVMYVSSRVRLRPENTYSDPEPYDTTTLR